MNKPLICAVAAAAFVATTPAGANPDKAGAVRLVAEAAAWGGLCVNWSLDRRAAESFLRGHRVAIRGDYRAVYGFAYARAHAKAMALQNAPNACDVALDLYGPFGRVLPGLLRPIYSNV